MSDKQGELLRVFQQYFVVSNGAPIDRRSNRKGSNLHDLADYAVVQINDTHPSVVIPELIRLDCACIELDEAISIVRLPTLTTQSLMKPLKNGLLNSWKVVHLVPIIENWTVDESRIQRSSCSKSSMSGRVHILAPWIIHYEYSVNGVAALYWNLESQSWKLSWQKIQQQNKRYHIPSLALHLTQACLTTWMRFLDMVGTMKQMSRKLLSCKAAVKENWKHPRLTTNVDWLVTWKRQCGNQYKLYLWHPNQRLHGESITLYVI